MSLNPGFLVINKQPGITSHDVVAMVRAVTGIRKVGHTGTLDPFAEGVLPLALGGATRLIRFLDESQKVYDATISLGSATDTGDPTGTVTEEKPVPALEQAGVREVLASFLGDRLQAPHRYSAVKVKGRRLYDYARKGEEVQVEPRPIHISSLELVSLSDSELRVVLSCSRGTYARGLADEIAVALGTVGHLRQLTRLRSGPFELERALSLSQLSELVANTPDWRRALTRRRGEDRVPWVSREQVFEGLAAWHIRPIETLPHLPLLPVGRGVAELLLRGGQPPSPPPGVRPGGLFAVVAGDQLLAVVEARGGGKSSALWRSPAAPR